MGRAAKPGELCTCGRQAVRVYPRDDGSEFGYCGVPDGGDQTGPCPFCGSERHFSKSGDAVRCPEYRLAP